jgi:adenylate kinase family enzyme
MARLVAERLGLPVVHLDRHYWSPGWMAPEAAEWRCRVAELAGAEAWVMDGNYSGTFDLRLPRAQALIRLDLPRCIYFPRAVWRSAATFGRERADIGPGCREQLDLDFLLNWVWTYPTRSRRRTLALVQLATSKRIVVLRRPREVAAFAAGLPASLA